MTRNPRRMVHALLALVAIATSSLVITAWNAPARAQQAEPEKKPTSFGGEDAKPAGKPGSIDDAFARCAADVKRLETDAIGVPFLAAGYVAFFAIPVVFLVLAGVRQRRLEAEMSELRERLARLSGGVGG